MKCDWVIARKFLRTRSIRSRRRLRTNVFRWGWFNGFMKGVLDMENTMPSLDSRLRDGLDFPRLLCWPHFFGIWFRCAERASVCVAVMRYRCEVVNNNQQRSFTADYTPHERISFSISTIESTWNRRSRSSVKKIALQWNHYYDTPCIWVSRSPIFISHFPLNSPPMRAIFGFLFFTPDVCRNLSTPRDHGQCAKVTCDVHSFLHFRRHFDTWIAYNSPLAVDLWHTQHVRVPTPQQKWNSLLAGACSFCCWCWSWTHRDILSDWVEV